MKELSRRNLLRQSGTLATAMALAGLPRTCRAAGANGFVRREYRAGHWAVPKGV